MSKALEANEPRVVQQPPQQLPSRAAVPHPQQMQMRPAAAAQTATLQHMNPPSMSYCIVISHFEDLCQCACGRVECVHSSQFL